MTGDIITSIILVHRMQPMKRVVLLSFPVIVYRATFCYSVQRNIRHPVEPDARNAQYFGKENTSAFQMAKVRRQDGMGPTHVVDRNGPLAAPQAVRQTYRVTEGAVDEFF